ncbi:hypothetical protein ACFSTD_03530 [Novosphingobium colocasiae]|uniref:Pilus assembly protein TadE n=1 Tax=Novosphingobium colocasiae TaxID=1256513 RepID=A0A918PD55_9SPHN|nr:hypothetical protein [Novosphingobium colocasiae]GGZ00146.1 hypothetical protein GCM10011614_13950 [Novosphingobium colocasiae]
MLLLMLGLAALLALAWTALRRDALASAAYGARVGCVCHFVSGQGTGQCKADIALAGLGQTAGLVMLSADDAARTMTARVPLLATQSATFDPATGCRLSPWSN